MTNMPTKPEALEDKNDELERLRQTEKPTLPSVVLLSVITLVYAFFNPNLREFQMHLIILLILLNTLVVFFQVFIVPSKYYSQLLGNLEAVVLSLFAVLFISWTGGFNSPLIFSLYLIMLSTPINEIITPVAMAIVQVYFLIFATILMPSMYETLVTDPIRAVLIILSPAGIAYFTATMLYETLTQKREKEKARHYATLLIEEKVKLETVITGIGDMVIAADTKNVIVLVNNAALDILGYKKEEMIGHSMTKFFSNLDLNSIHRTQEFSVIKHNSEVMIVRIRFNPLKDSIGQEIGKVMVLHDVSAEKEFERMKLDFVSMAAHELRTPLTSIKGYLSFLKESATQKFSADERIFVERISINTNSLSSLVENLLNISRIERRNLDLNLLSINMVELIKLAIDQIKDLAADNNIRINFKPQQTVGNVYVDKLRIGEVLNNLLDNAIKYSSRGGTITISLSQSENDVTTLISDTGIGIPQASLKHLFTKFYRVSGVLEQGAKGTGLGLFICKSIIELHKGRIWVESELGKGSSFYFSLPLAKRH